MATKTRKRQANGRFAKKSSGGALVRTRTRSVTKYKTRKVYVPDVKRQARRGRGRRGGGMSATKLVIAGAALGLLTSQNTGPAVVRTTLEKIPGQKTFGSAAVAGLAIGALGHFTSIGGRFRPWMRAAGVIGIALAAVKLGTENKDFKFLGDGATYDDDDALMDVEG